ncbi:MAG: hypothetical protein ABH967_00230 [Patescibacteria group bacterium]
MERPFYYKSWFWVLIVVFCGALIFSAFYFDDFIENVFGEDVDMYFAMGSFVLFFANIILGIFFVQRGTGKTELQALEETASSWIKINILWSFIQFVIIAILFLWIRQSTEEWPWDLLRKVLQ